MYTHHPAIPYLLMSMISMSRCTTVPELAVVAHRLGHQRMLTPMLAAQTYKHPALPIYKQVSMRAHHGTHQCSASMNLYAVKISSTEQNVSWLSRVAGTISFSHVQDAVCVSSVIAPKLIVLLL